MEELLAYAYLLGMDLIPEEIYEEKLHKLFLENPTDEDLLELEFLSGNRKETVRYIRIHIDYNSMDFDRFGSAMYSLWEGLPGNLQSIKPFWTLSYADDPLSWGDVEQSREIYEEMLDYYEADSLTEYL